MGTIYYGLFTLFLWSAQALRARPVVITGQDSSRFRLVRMRSGILILAIRH